MDERPTIADKVRFWEEQDRINKELIPRVLKIHELVTDHISGHQDASIQIGVVEARMVKRLNTEVAAVETRLREGIDRARKQAMMVAGVSLVVAVVNIILSVVL